MYLTILLVYQGLNQLGMQLTELQSLWIGSQNKILAIHWWKTCCSNRLRIIEHCNLLHVLNVDLELVLVSHVQVLSYFTLLYFLTFVEGQGLICLIHLGFLWCRLTSWKLPGSFSFITSIVQIRDDLHRLISSHLLKHLLIIDSLLFDHIKLHLVLIRNV